MNFISVREIRTNSRKVWDLLKEKMDLVITSNGQPIAVISSAADGMVEEQLEAIRTARAMLALQAAQLEAASDGRDQITAEEIGEEIAAVRGRRRR